MELETFLQHFNSHMECVQKGDAIYILDTCYQGDKEHEYGVVEKFLSVQELTEYLKQGNAGLLIPDFYFDGHIDFLLRDDYPHFYKMSDEQIATIETVINTKGFSHSDKTLLELGFHEAYDDIHEICQILRGDEIPTIDDFTKRKDTMTCR